MKERTKISQELCTHVKILLAGGATGIQAAQITNTSSGTISRIKAAGFDYQTFMDNTEKRRLADMEAKNVAKEPEQLAGQIQMEIPAEEKPEMSDQTKMMRFQAHQADRMVKVIEESTAQICTKLDRLNDTLCQIMRAVRKE